jgi:hypothetical protein
LFQTSVSYLPLHHFQFKLVFSQFKLVFAKFKLALPVKTDTSKTDYLLDILRSNRHIFLANGGPNVAVGMLETTLAKVRRNRLWKDQISGAVEILCTVLLDGHSGTGGCENARTLVTQESLDGGLEHGEHVLDGVKHGRVGAESNELGISKLFLIEDFLNRGVDGSVVAHKGNLDSTIYPVQSDTLEHIVFAGITNLNLANTNLNWENTNLNWKWCTFRRPTRWCARPLTSLPSPSLSLALSECGQHASRSL